MTRLRRVASGLLLTVGLTVGCRRVHSPSAADTSPASKSSHAPDLATPNPVAVDAQPAAPTHRVRPTNVPEAAQWVGGPDGGAYVWLAPTPKAAKGIVRGKVFHENGDLWFDGSFRVEQPSSIGDLAQPEIFDGWDGERLYLANGRRLKALRSTRSTGKALPYQ